MRGDKLDLMVAAIKEQQFAKIINTHAHKVTAKPSSKSRMLDLFSGTGMVGQVFSFEGYEVVSLDVDPKFKPTVLVDVMDWDYKAAYPSGYFDIIFACPPCTHFSRARTTIPRDLDSADRIIEKTLEIVEYFRPRMWFMEILGMAC